ncbi:helix-turn-helix transcriptional regulator [Nonomuraea sp. K274]|uniref:Helix-turn-helix transcriptional regulator n=1 Tax=Nonomuraea cypriaca TaxID=1187855 RepID=A0A931ABL6_9ACTN|nr:helix-turn-helix transcriptional regulator [Nonomuraea cypriaca]
MVPIRSHWRYLKSGKRIRVRAHNRNSTTSNTTDSDPSGAIVPIVALIIGFGLLSGGVAAVAGSSRSEGEADRAPRPSASSPVTLPPGPKGQLAEALRNARLKSGLSIKEVSARTGITTWALEGFERAQVIPNASDLKALTPPYRLTGEQWTILEATRSHIFSRP